MKPKNVGLFAPCPDFRGAMVPLARPPTPLSTPITKISSENIKKCKNLSAVNFANVANRVVGNFVRFDFWSGGGARFPLKKGKSRAKCEATGVFDVWLLNIVEQFAAGEKIIILLVLKT